MKRIKTKYTGENISINVAVLENLVSIQIVRPQGASFSPQSPLKCQIGRSSRIFKNLCLDFQATDSNLEDSISENRNFEVSSKVSVNSILRHVGGNIKNA